MKKTTTVNIGKMVFHIDEDAFIKLDQYLNAIQELLQNDPNKKDIIEDIEQRIAELLNDLISGKEQAVSIEHIEKIIVIMGDPKEFSSENPTTYTDEGRKRAQKRLYRDPENKIIAGVASGLSAYFNIDPVIIRILFFALTFMGAGFPIPLYIILWIVLPEAETTSQRMEMRGENINVDSIKKNAKQEYESIKSNVNNYIKSDSFRKGSAELGSAIGRIAPVVVKFIFSFVLIALAIAIIVLIGLQFSSFVFDLNIPPTLDPEADYIIQHINWNLMFIGSLLIAKSIILSLFSFLLNTIYRQKTASKIGFLFSIVLAIVGFCIIIYTVSCPVVNYQEVKEFIFLS